MALLNDGPVNRVDELAREDSSLLETASIEGIDVVARIASAQEAIASEILAFLLNGEETDPLLCGAGSYRRRSVGVSDVVVTPELKRWHALEALEGVYRDANGHQFNDRYQWKAQEFGTQAKAAREQLFTIGVGLTADPMAKAATPVLTTIAGIGAAATVYFAAALVNAEGQEGAASDAVAVSLADDTQAQVRLSGAPANARGWNVYAGSDAGSMTRQNEAALGTAEVWTQPQVVSSGAAMPSGQTAMTHVTQIRTIRRG